MPYRDVWFCRVGDAWILQEYADNKRKPPIPRVYLTQEGKDGVSAEQAQLRAPDSRAPMVEKRGETA